MRERTWPKCWRAAPPGFRRPSKCATRCPATLPKPLETIVGNCLAHARRHFVEVVANFPEPCRHVLESLGEVYGYDAQAEALGLPPEERLRFHQLTGHPFESHPKAAAE